MVNSGDTENCPFKGSNRSPDSFIRVNTNGQGEQQYTRVSLLSQQQSSRVSHISQDKEVQGPPAVPTINDS